MTIAPKIRKIALLLTRGNVKGARKLANRVGNKLSKEVRKGKNRDEDLEELNLWCIEIAEREFYNEE